MGKTPDQLTTMNPRNVFKEITKGVGRRLAVLALTYKAGGLGVYALGNGNGKGALLTLPRYLEALGYSCSSDSRSRSNGGAYE